MASAKVIDRLSWLVLEILGFLDIQKEERTVQKAIKEAAKRNDMVSAKVDSKSLGLCKLSSFEKCV